MHVMLRPNRMVCRSSLPLSVLHVHYIYSTTNNSSQVQSWLQQFQFFLLTTTFSIPLLFDHSHLGEDEFYETPSVHKMRSNKFQSDPNLFKKANFTENSSDKPKALSA